ncbi:2'-5' RNA ligase family protein [Bradyrhizobium sp. BR 10289]|uniref:2'-5' RNA ligase family protein n=1 Tax=Bradyrhizobium sp. BR 10289 TaxID=2749993 RepID=UPI001C64EDA6|nr:2'-5' RNA ligase family protein [Bradyrhizobium sp. BR 10289]MBW7970639.1 2'-5' RNA ligase family protein [Bradyrhizobium sp. BR 10289]
MERTFILTAELDTDGFAWLDGLRREHFPPERNLLPAHLTLFHRLSSAQTERLDDAAMPAAAIFILYERIRLLGSGVAVEITAPALAQLRTAVRHVMGGDFSKQDRQSWRPHVTVQNKVTAAAARQLHDRLSAGFKPRTGGVSGLLVWEYLGGPWRLVRRLSFHQPASDAVAEKK